MDYRCLELTHESLSDGSFEDTEAGKRNYATCHVLKYRKIRWCQGNGIHTDCSKMFFCIFPLDNWECCLRSFSTIVVKDVAEIMSLQMMCDEVLAGELQQLDWIIWDGKFHAASRTVILTSLPTIHKYVRMSDNPAHHMTSWGFYVTSASKLI